jgi:hypothetical protein
MEYIKHSLCPALWFTPGVNAMREKRNAYWLVDAIASYYMRNGSIDLSDDQAFRCFHSWRLIPDGKGGATLKAAVDSGVLPAITQEIPYTDFEFDGDEAYMLFCGLQQDSHGNDVWILMKPSEY